MFSVYLIVLAPYFGMLLLSYVSKGIMGLRARVKIGNIILNEVEEAIFLLVPSEVVAKMEGMSSGHGKETALTARLAGNANSIKRGCILPLGCRKLNKNASFPEGLGETVGRIPSSSLIG